MYLGVTFHQTLHDRPDVHIGRADILDEWTEQSVVLNSRPPIISPSHEFPSIWFSVNEKQIKHVIK